MRNHEMGIRFNCQCGRELNVKDAMAGKKGKCPGCGAVINVPTLEEVAALEKAKAEAEAAEAAAQAEAEAGMIECPHCQKKIAPDSVICIGCGTNLKTGEKMGASAAEGATGGADEYDFFKVAPDMLTDPTQAVGIIVEADPTPLNFQKALLFLAIGLLIFSLVAPYGGDEAISDYGATKNSLPYWIFALAFVLAIVAIVIDGILAQVAGSMFGSTGAGLANVLMAIIASRAMLGMVLILPGVYLWYSQHQTSAIAMWGTGVLVRLVWGSFMYVTILTRAHGVPMVQSICFAGVSAIIRILLFSSPLLFSEYSLLYKAGR